jgi:hypothetical protein
MPGRVVLLSAFFHLWREIAPHLRIVGPNPLLFLPKRFVLHTLAADYTHTLSLSLYKFSRSPLRQPCASTLSHINQASLSLSKHNININIHYSYPNSSKMRSFQQVILFLFALVAFAFAQDDTSYVATTTLTSTVQVVLTATVSPGASSTPVPIYSVPSNGTATAYPTGSAAPTAPSAPSQPTVTDFPGAASGLSVNGAFIAVVAAGLGYFAL